MECVTVLDSGDEFYDDQCRLHTNASGWLAIHSAIHYAVYCDDPIIIPRKCRDAIRKVLFSKQLAPHKLKELVRVKDLDADITYSNIEDLAKTLNIYFKYHTGAVYNVNQDIGGSPRIGPLWLINRHPNFYCLMPDEDFRRDCAFVQRFPMYKIRTIDLFSCKAALNKHGKERLDIYDSGDSDGDPDGILILEEFAEFNPDTSKDYLIAVKLSKELNSLNYADDNLYELAIDLLEHDQK